MRTSGTKTAAVTALQGITPDAPADVTFRYVDFAGRQAGAVTERTFMLELGAIPRHAGFMSTDAWLANWDLTVFYAPAEGVEDRIGDDFDRISQTLHQLHSQDAEIYMVDVVPGVVQRIEGGLAAVASLDITYRRTGI